MNSRLFLPLAMKQPPGHPRTDRYLPYTFRDMEDDQVPTPELNLISRPLYQFRLEFFIQIPLKIY